MNIQYSSQQPHTEYHVASTPAAAPEPADLRTTLITKIWSRAMGMLALCIPLAAVMHNSQDSVAVVGVALPLAVIVGATISTSVIWVTGHRSPLPSALPPGVDPQQLNELEQRLFNLETMDRYERLSYAEKMTRPAPVSDQTVTNYETPTRPMQSGMR